MQKLGADRKALVVEPAAARLARFAPRPDLEAAANDLFGELENARLRNMPWWASESRRFYRALARLYGGGPHGGNPSDEKRRLATCYYQLRWFPQWEQLQRAGGLVPARDVENAILSGAAGDWYPEMDYQLVAAFRSALSRPRPAAPGAAGSAPR